MAYIYETLKKTEILDMESETNLKISISYLLKNEEYHSFEIEPSDYFAPPEEGETEYELDSPPRHNEIADYLPPGTNKTNLKNIEVLISSISNKAFYRRTEAMWCGNWLSWTTKHDGKRESFSEILIEIAESSGESTQLVKIYRDTHDLKIIMHLLSKIADPDNSESIL